MLTMAEDFQETNAETAGRRVNYKAILALPLLKNSGQRVVGILKTHFENPGHKIYAKQKMGVALNRLDRWAAEPRNNLPSLLKATTETLEACLQTLPDKRTRTTYRSQLRKMYDLFVTAALLKENPVKRKPPHERDISLPDIIQWSGDKAAQGVSQFMIKDRHYRAFLRHFCKWLAIQYIYDIGKVSPSDVLDYVSTLTVDRFRHYSSLRFMFAHLAKEGIIKKNPFIYEFKDDVPYILQDNHIRHLLILAHNSGPAFEAIVRKIPAPRADERFLFNRRAALDYAAQWLMDFEGIKRFQDITLRHILRLRYLGLSDFAETTQTKTFPYAIGLLSQFVRAGLMPPFALEKGVFKRVAIPPDDLFTPTDVQEADAFFTQRKMHDASNETTRTPNIVPATAPSHNDAAILQFEELAYAERLDIATIIEYMERGTHKLPLELAERGHELGLFERAGENRPTQAFKILYAQGPEGSLRDAARRLRRDHLRDELRYGHVYREMNRKHATTASKRPAVKSQPRFMRHHK